MDTLTTIQNVRRTDGGAYAVTFLGDNVAGTFNDDLGKRAQKAALEDLPVQVKLAKKGDKLFIEKLEIIFPPEELGGVSDEEQAEVNGLAPGETEEDAVAGDEAAQTYDPDPTGPDPGPTEPEELAAAEATTDQGDDAFYTIDRLEILSKVSTKTLGEKLNEVISVVNELSKAQA